MTSDAATLLSVLAAAAVAVCFSVVVVLRHRAAEQVEPAGRVRFPARALERAILTGVGCCVAAFFAVWDLEPEGRIGIAVVGVSALWMLWRGSFLALRAGRG